MATGLAGLRREISSLGHSIRRLDRPSQPTQPTSSGLRCTACLGRCTADFQAWLSTSCVRVAITRFMADRAQARYLAEAHTETDWWGVYGKGLDAQGRAARIRAEREGLRRLIAQVGLDAGWRQWHAEALDWPWGWRRLDDEDLLAAIDRERAMRDDHRSRCSAWQREHRQWRPGMSPAEHDRFELSLLEGRQTEV